MTLWLEVLLVWPFAGAFAALLFRSHAAVLRWSMTVLLVQLVGAMAAMLWMPVAPLDSSEWFALDAVAAPMLPMFALVHAIVLFGTAKAVINHAYCIRALLAAGFSSLALTSHNDNMLLIVLILNVVLPLWELRDHGRTARLFLIYMMVFIGLLIAALFAGAAEKTPLGIGLLLLAMLVRGGVAPAHAWLPSLFSGTTYGTALLFVVPMLEIFVIMRFLLTSAPEWMLQAGGYAALATALYAGCLAIVQSSMRRFFAYLCLSQTSLVMFAVLLHTPNGVTAALCLWISSALSLTGLAFAVRALESRFGPMSLNEFHGHYEQVPALAVLFLITGLASVGFPGTIGFVPMELLFSGSFQEGLAVSAAIAVVAMLNGIAIIRAYFALFTGRKQQNSISLGITPLERVGVIMIALTVFLGVWLSPDVVSSRLNTAEQLLETSQAIPQGLEGGEVAALFNGDELLVRAGESLK